MTSVRTIATLADDAVADFASAVRAQLSDLPPDEVDDLTDGLEADLLDRIADSGEDLGDPVAYADELRSAAGIPPRAQPTRSHGIRSALAELAVARREWLARHPQVARFGRFLARLAPAWWLLRGGVVWVVGQSAFGNWRGPDATSWLLLVVCVVASIVLGVWSPKAGWLRGVGAVANGVLAIIALFVPAMLAQIANNALWSFVDENAQQVVDTNGVFQNGQQVTNIFAYDANGTPIPVVRLFTQDGTRLQTTGFGDTLVYTDQWVMGEPGETGNVDDSRNNYPLWQAPTSDSAYDGTLPNSAQQAPFPYASVAPVAHATGGPTVTATPAP